MKYLLQESETPGWWVFTDTEHKIVIRFKEHEFNDSQEVTVLEDGETNPHILARVMREMGDWIGRHHYDKVF